LSRLSTSFVLGYHGCDQKVADKILAGGETILQSDKDIDWLGPGAYFWESDPTRALEFAKEQVKRGKYKNPTVIGAVLDLRNCLNLSSREGIEQLRAAYGSFEKFMQSSGGQMPENGNPNGSNDSDRLFRYLDCAVIRHLHGMIDSQRQPVSKKERIEPYDSVRGLFTEGEAAYPGAKLYEKSHVQIAVRNQDCILGVFRPRNFPPE
jgi:hypothetical protein